jgi:hypothetical protein
VFEPSAQIDPAALIDCLGEALQRAPAADSVDISTLKHYSSAA